MTKDELFEIITKVGGNLTYPFNYNSLECDYLDYVASLINKYLELLDKLDSNSIKILNSSLSNKQVKVPLGHPLSLLDDAHAVSNKIIEVLQLSFRTLHFEAYQKLLEFFEEDNCHFYLLLPRIIERGRTFYRLRKDSIDWTNYQGEMFHIPFQKRHLVSSQRFSIPGCPIIYMAGTLETAWYELNKPDLADIICTKLKFKDKACFIDLGYPLNRYTEDWEVYSLFVFYPLIIACSVSVKYQDSPFKPEYMLPQLMLRVVRNYDDVDGISYMSNKTPLQNDVFSEHLRNYAVITRNHLCREGYDADLASRMLMTKPFRYDNDEFIKYGFSEKSDYEKVGLLSLCHVNDKYEEINLLMKE